MKTEETSGLTGSMMPYPSATDRKQAFMKGLSRDERGIDVRSVQQDIKQGSRKMLDQYGNGLLDLGPGLWKEARVGM
jgi:hypothetical protein